MPMLEPCKCVIYNQLLLLYAFQLLQQVSSTCVLFAFQAIGLLVLCINSFKMCAAYPQDGKVGGRHLRVCLAYFASEQPKHGLHKLLPRVIFSVICKAVQDIQGIPLKWKARGHQLLMGNQNTVCSCGCLSCSFFQLLCRQACFEQLLIPV